MKISFCGKCGAELGTGSNFCTNCGWKLPDEAEKKIIESLNELRQGNTESSVVTTSASSESKKITASSDVKKCISCGTSLPQSTEFCTQCGAEQVEAESTSEKYCINCGNVMSVNDMFCAKCGANQNADVKRQYYAQAVPAFNTPKKKSNGGLIVVLVMLLFITSIVGGVLIFGLGGVKAEEMSGKWSIGFTINDMNDDMDEYDYSDCIGETTEGTLVVDLDEDGNGTARLVTTVDGTDYDYEVMNAQYSKGKLVCIADTTSESIEFTGKVRKKGGIYKLSGKFEMSFIDDVKTTASGKWTATKDVNQSSDTGQANSSKKNATDKGTQEEYPNLAAYVTILDILGEWEGTAVLSSFTGYEKNRDWLLENNAPDDVIEQFDNMKGKESPIFLEIEDDYGWEVSVDVKPMGELSFSDLDIDYDENNPEIDGKMKLENGRFLLAYSERDGDEGTAGFNFNGAVLTNDDGSYTLKGSLTVSFQFDSGTVPIVMVFDYDMLRSVNTEE
jgi:hypothetical protein